MEIDMIKSGKLPAEFKVHPMCTRNESWFLSTPPQILYTTLPSGRVMIGDKLMPDGYKVPKA